ncbi:MAG: alpha/beta hydrolase [Actinomycetota bacterium]|nr:alpha/beta hydrolase [Actinomycetota bacterium]
MNWKKGFATAGTAVGIGAGLVFQHSTVARRRRNDPEGNEVFGSRRGVRSRKLALDDDAQLFIEEAGPIGGRGAVFVHSSAMRTDVWHYQMPGIGGHRLVFYDLRGHGLSHPKGTAPFTIKQLAQDLLAVMDDAELQEAVIVGHSIGGMIALELCKEQPELMGSRIKGLVLANTTYRPAAESLGIGGAAVSRLERLTRRPFDVLGSQSVPIDRLRGVLPPSDLFFMAVSLATFGPSASAGQIDLIYDMMSETGSDILFDLIKSYRHFDVRDFLGQVTVPALVIAGTHDRLTMPANSVHLAEHMPLAELRLLEGCGHMSMLERHAEFNSMLAAFLDDTLGRIA